MNVTRYYRNAMVQCKPLETLIDKYEADGFEVDPDVDLIYRDALIHVEEKKKDLHDTIRSRGEPESFRTYIRVQKDYGNIERVTFYRFQFDTEGHSLEVASHDLALINEGFEYAAQIFKLEYCDRSEVSGEREKVAFLGHSFDSKGEAYAARVSKLLDSIGFEVLSGEGYSPRPVSRKVRERLDVAQVVIMIFSKKDDLTWLTQEAAAELKNKPVIVLIEAGLDWKPGIHGDVEYLRFPADNIDAAFLGILEGLDEEGFIESYRRKTSAALKQITEQRAASSSDK